MGVGLRRVAEKYVTFEIYYFDRHNIIHDEVLIGSGVFILHVFFCWNAGSGRRPGLVSETFRGHPIREMKR